MSNTQLPSEQPITTLSELLKAIEKRAEGWNERAAVILNGRILRDELIVVCNTLRHIIEQPNSAAPQVPVQEAGAAQDVSPRPAVTGERAELPAEAALQDYEQRLDALFNEAFETNHAAMHDYIFMKMELKRLRALSAKPARDEEAVRIAKNTLKTRRTESYASERALASALLRAVGESE